MAALARGAGNDAVSADALVQPANTIAALHFFLPPFFLPPLDIGLGLL